MIEEKKTAFEVDGKNMHMNKKITS